MISLASPLMLGKLKLVLNELELFVEGVADLLGGTQLRDGQFNPERIADGKIPNQIRVTGDNSVVIGGRSVSGQFKFGFDNLVTARSFAGAVSELFGHIDETNAISTGDL
jgi:hypothetical protein